MNRRHSFLFGVIATAAAAVVVLGVGLTELAPAQTTPTVPTTTSPPTTSPLPTTTLPAETTSTSSEPTTTTTTVPAASTDSGDDTPWALIAVAIVLVVAIISLLVAWSRRRGQRQQSIVDWQRREASAASEAGATARLLAAGTPADAGIIQQIRGTVRTFEGLVGSAPDDAMRASAQHGLEAVRELSIALDADANARSAQPPFPPAQIAAAAAGLQNAASEADVALSTLYNRHRPRRRS
jgi:cytoskeletal protein RodZ